MDSRLSVLLLLFSYFVLFCVVGLCLRVDVVSCRVVSCRVVTWRAVQ